MNRKLFRLVHTQARDGACRAITEAPDGYVCTISEPTRNLEINAALHATLTEIAARMKWAGKHWDVETWKRLLVAAWTRASGDPVVMLPALDGAGVDIVFRRTSQMTQPEMRDLMSFIDAWCAEQPELAQECAP